MRPQLFQWRLARAAPCARASWVFFLYLLFLGCVSVLGLLLLELQVPSSFLFSFNYWYLIDIISGTKGVRTSRKKPCAVTSYLLHHLHSFATEVSTSEGTLETCEFLWLVLCSVSSTFLFGGEYRKPDIWVSENMVSSISSPCPHFSLRMLQSWFYF